MVQFGIWQFDEKFGLIGKPENLPEVFLSFGNLWDIEVTSQDQVWKWPIYMAKNSWFTPKVADDFNKAFFYAQEFMNGQRPVPWSLDFDARTIQLQTEILMDFFPGPE